ncbi:clarin-3-like [Arctopsyche grandis]|uniref:clarin-3-like n=1 Tax=Arctopsyche grandis TaxID=121162 RepID=UPI00406D72BD
MAVSYHIYVFATFLLSCLSIAFLVGSLATERWLEAEARWADSNRRSDSINYGLFKGTFVANSFGTPNINRIELTCIYGKNICGYSCENTAEKRLNEITSMVNGIIPSLVCESDTGSRNNDIEWLNAGIFLTTVILLGLAIVFSTLCAGLGVYNTSIAPINPLLGVFGLYIWHGCSAGCDLLALIIWGANFDINLQRDLAFPFTEIFHESRTATVGYSYWFVFASMLCHIVCEVLLFVRLWRIRTEPPPPTINIDTNTDNTIFLY